MRPDDLAAKPLDRAPIVASWPLTDGPVLAMTLPGSGWDLWALDLDRCDCDRCVESWHTGDASPASAPHEQLGPLPARWTDRLARLAGPRCGQPRRDGRPCRRHVARPGHPCHQHTRGGR